MVKCNLCHPRTLGCPKKFLCIQALESIYHNIFVIILLLYHLGSQKKCLALVSIHYFVSFGHFKIRTLLSQGDKTGNFFTLYRQDCGVKKTSIESTLCFFIPNTFVVRKTHLILLSTLNCFYYIEVFRQFTCLFWDNLKDCKNLVLWLGHFS